MANRFHAPVLALLALLAASAVPVSAEAQPVSAVAAGTLSWSKSEAILGGAPSALQTILAQQKAIAQVSWSALQPASFAATPLVSAVLRNRPFAASGVTSGRPDVFGTIALSVGRTPLDARWHHVEHSPLVGTPARYASTLEGLAPIERLERVNYYVNHRVHFTDDQVDFGRPDVWSAANDTLRRGKGDCEDYAIAKLQMLRRAGIPDRDLYLVIVKDLVRRADHAVLVVRAGGQMLLLDNGTDSVLDSESVSDYRPILTFATTGTWTHGYRVQAAPVYVSEHAGPVLIPAGDQRSRSASLLALNTGFIR